MTLPDKPSTSDESSVPGDKPDENQATPDGSVDKNANAVNGRSAGIPSPQVPDPNPSAPAAVPSVDELLEAQKDRRVMRRILFGVLALVALAFFVTLLRILVSIFSVDSLPHTVITTAHGATLLIAGLSMLTAASLSIMLGLIRIASEPTPKDERSPEPTIATAFSEGLKAIAEAIRSR
jgi:hypothetical protein